MYNINNIPNGVFDNNDNRSKEIINILCLQDNNIYTKLLQEIIAAYDKQQIDTITAYQYINAVIGTYYQNVVIPKEDEQLRQQRQQRQKNKSGIDICNPDDPTETAIKQKLEINQQFPNFKKMLETIGIDNLNMHKSDNTLITSYQDVHGGKQKAKAEKILNQYMQYDKIAKGKQKIEILDIFDEPVIVIFDGKGQSNNGFYINRLTAALIQGILKNDDNSFNTTVNKLIHIIPITNDTYDKAKHFIDINNSAELLELFNDFFDDDDINIKEYMIRNLIHSCYNELRHIIFRLLDNLANNYCVISYDESFQYITADGQACIANKSERSIIKQAQIQIMKDMGAKNLNTIYYRKKTKQFYDKVIEYINKKYNYHWHRLRKSISITIEDRERLIEIYNSYCNNDNNKKIAEAKDKFTKRIQNLIDKDFDNNRKKLSENIDKAYQNNDIMELKEMKIIDDDDITKIANKNQFKYPNNYKEIQNILLQLLIND